VNLDPKLRPDQILAIAVKSEIEAADIYASLQQQVRNELLQKKLKFLVFEEKKHRAILERLFSQRYPEEELKIPESSFLPRISVTLDEKSSVLDLFKVALNAEKTSEDFYAQAADRAGEGSQKILKYLSRVERSHYFMIQSEIGLLEKFPDYYNVEDFHLGHEMVHVGP
jgi:rubrerythrin